MATVGEIVGADGTSKLAVGTTSKAASVTLYDPQGREVMLQPTAGSFLAGILWRDTGAVTNTPMFSIFNPTTTTVIARIRTLRFSVIFDGTASAAGRNIFLARTGFTAPTGGTQVTPTKKRSADAASVCDVRYANAGLTVGSMTTVSEELLRLNLSIATTGQIQQYELNRQAQFRRLTGAFDLKPGEGIAIFDGNAATAGQGVCGYIEWDETAQ